MFKVPHKDRITYGPMGSGDWAGNNGAFQINLSNRTDAMVVASNGEGWEHVSVRMIDRSTGKDRTPTWSEMCKIKDIFWGDEDCVIQFHPPKSEYVNNHPHVLHLWRPVDQAIPQPDSILVGIKGLIKSKL
jgi:hypothetical protein